MDFFHFEKNHASDQSGFVAGPWQEANICNDNKVETKELSLILAALSARPLGEFATRGDG